MTRARNGMLLLEVMLGIAILGIAAVALVTLLGQTVETVRHGREAERNTALATEMLNRTSVWSASQLDARVGITHIGRWNVDVHVIAPHLYSVTVRDTASDAIVLKTSVYRAGKPADAQ